MQFQFCYNQTFRSCSRRYIILRFVPFYLTKKYHWCKGAEDKFLSLQNQLCQHRNQNASFSYHWCHVGRQWSRYWFKDKPNWSIFVGIHNSARINHYKTNCQFSRGRKSFCCFFSIYCTIICNSCVAGFLEINDLQLISLKPRGPKIHSHHYEAVIVSPCKQLLIKD